jgi:hypothetical protein
MFKKAKTLPKSHMHIFIVAIANKQMLENVSLEVWEPRGVDYTVDTNVPFIQNMLEND